MSIPDSKPHKSRGDDGGARKEYMHYADSHSLRAEKSDKEVADGINGTISLHENDVAAIDALPNSRIRVLAEKDGRSVVTERQLHANGRSFTLPSSDRQKLGLEPGDEIEVWIDLVERKPKDSKSQSTLSKKTSKEDEQLNLKFVGEEEYHYVDDEDSDETKCGISLEGREYKGPTNDDPGAFLTLCNDCAVRSSKAMTNEQLAKWLAGEVGFEIGGGPASYFNKKQMVELRDYILDLQDQLSEASDNGD